MTNLLKKIFGDTSKRELKKIKPIINQIDALADKYAAFSDSELQAETPRFKALLQEGTTLDDLLPEAFAAFREACRRVLGQYPFEVQLIGGVVLHQGRIAEMKTGEGKTLTATLPAYLNALAGKGVHIVTVNDYLAKYQGEIMSKVYIFMGLSCGVLVHGLTKEQRKRAYACDITYCTNNEIGFDYLRDNMAVRKSDQVQRGHFFAIVDEVDSILIDEARTPLIISGPGEQSTDLYKHVDSFVRTLESITVVETDSKESKDDIETDYIVDEKHRSATLTLRGIAKAETFFNVDNLMDLDNTALVHHINQAIKAHGCMHRDTDYIVKDGSIVIIDEFTGRLMFGRRYSEGLHQAIEAKENVSVLRESKTLATVTYQNYFRLYEKISGMTGTALTEEEEFRFTYNLDAIEIPTNKPKQRIDNSDLVFKTEKGKLAAVVRKIKECHAKGQPILVGTATIEKSEQLSQLLQTEGLSHQILNAKHHEKEAAMVAQAGQLGAITIATNMAGRGTDIMLGGNAEFMARNELIIAGYESDIIQDAISFKESKDPEVLTARQLYQDKLAEYKQACAENGAKVRELGGLCILGTERHESRRIDNQLRGRAGRQGDPGESTFYLSLEDDLLRLFGSEKIQSVMDSLGIDEDTPIEHKRLTSAIENAQQKVEGRNFDSRMSTLEYDGILNYQRELVYKQREEILSGIELKPKIQNMLREYITQTISDITADSDTLTHEQVGRILLTFNGVFLFPGEIHITDFSAQAITDAMISKAMTFYEAKEQQIGSSSMREMERVVLLKTADQLWMDHIDAMQELRRGIGLNAYAQKNPVEEYSRQGMEMFEEMTANIRRHTARLVCLARIQRTQHPVQEKGA